MSYTTEIRKALGKLGKNGTENPDAKHNVGRMLGEVFLWDQVAKFAEGKAEDAWADLTKEGLIPNKKELEPGDHELAYSPSFVVVARVTQPVKQFSRDELAKLMRESKWKVPESATMEMIEQAKVPTTSRASLKVIER